MVESPLEGIDVILYRPQSSDNIGAVARAMKNFGLRHLILVSPKRYDAARAHTLAVSSGELLDTARIVSTLDEAVAEHVLVIPTTERAMAGRELPVSPSQAAGALLEATRGGTSRGETLPGPRAALLFGEEATGLSNAALSRFAVYSAIPAHPDKRSLNLAQAALLYAWELHQAAGAAHMPQTPGPVVAGEQPAAMQIVTRLRTRLRQLGLATGFLHAQAPDHTLDELMRLLQRAQPTQREMELLMAAVDQLERTSTVLSNG